MDSAGPDAALAARADAGANLNFNMIFAALVIGLAGVRDRLSGLLLLVAFAAGLLLTDRSMFWEELAKLGVTWRAAIGAQPFSRPAHFSPSSSGSGRGRAGHASPRWTPV